MFGFYLDDFKELFYLFCLGFLVYRYITVGRKYPLFGTRQKSGANAENTSQQQCNNSLFDDTRVRHWDITDLRSDEFHSHMNDFSKRLRSDDD